MAACNRGGMGLFARPGMHWSGDGFLRPYWGTSWFGDFLLEPLTDAAVSGHSDNGKKETL